MYGASYRGNNQYWAAMTAPPGLKCIFPEVAPFDGYFSGRPNGVFWDRYLKDWGGYTQALVWTSGSTADNLWAGRPPLTGPRAA